MSYDANVNMIKDLDRDIVTIKYNLLNLPELIQFKNGCQIKHTYAADGQKLSSRYITVNAGVYQPLNQGQVIENLDVNENDNVTVDGMDYIGNIEYQIYRYFDWDVTFEPAELKYIFRVHNPEGFAKNTTTTNGPIYSYYRKDHLGNNREVWRASYTWGSTTHPAATVQRTQYYPSGLPWKSNSGDNPGSQPYKYGGKEFVEMHGLDEYDFHARGYYPAIMRTTTMDPLAEKYYDISPYAWCGNNPVNRIDPTGMAAYSTNDPYEISKFISSIKNGNSYDMSSWTYQTDEEYISENSPKYFTYDDTKDKISIQWPSVDNGEFTMNSKMFSASIFRKKKSDKNRFLEFINNRYANPLDFLTSPEGDLILSSIASKIGVSKQVAVILFTTNIGMPLYQNNKGQISSQKMRNDIVQVLMTTGVTAVAGMGVGFLFALELEAALYGAKKVNEFNKEFEIYLKKLPENFYY